MEFDALDAIVAAGYDYARQEVAAWLKETGGAAAG